MFRFSPAAARWRAVLAGLFGVVLLAWFGPPVFAYAGDGRDVVSRQAVTIPKGEIAEDVLVLGNDATVSGVVTDNLVVVGGNIHLTPTARAGVVVDLGGHLTQDAGAQANAVFTLAFDQPLLNSVMAGSVLVLAYWAWRLALSAALVAFPAAASLIVGSRLREPIEYLGRSVRRTGLTGLLASVVCWAVAGMAAVTVIGLPVTAIVLCLYGVAGVVGLASVSAWMGQRMKLGREDRFPGWNGVVGAAFVMAFGNIPLVGPVLLAGVWFVGIGAVTAWLWQMWRGRRGHRG